MSTADIISRSSRVRRRSGIGGEPDISVEAKLVRRMAREHGAAARLRDVTDEKTGPPVNLRHLFGDSLKEGNEPWMAPVAVTRQAHHLPSSAINRQRNATGHAAAGVAANHAGRKGCRLRLASE